MFPKSSIEQTWHKRFETRQAQLTGLYALIGEFVASFEAICDSMRYSIDKICTRDAPLQREIAALTGELTAQPLLASYRAIMVMNCGPKDEVFFDTLCKSIQDMIATRNHVVHSHWQMGCSNMSFTEFTDGRGTKVKNNKTGIGLKEMALTEKTFRPLIEQCTSLSIFVNGMGHAVAERIDLETIYKIENRQVVQLGPLFNKSA